MDLITMDLPLAARAAIRCRSGCSGQTAKDAARCAHCGGESERAAPQTLVGKIKRALGIELSAEILVINLEDDGQFFTAQEIDAMLQMENFVVLGLEQIPDYDQMFYQSKRVRKPVNRKND